MITEWIVTYEIRWFFPPDRYDFIAGGFLDLESALQRAFSTLKTRPDRDCIEIAQVVRDDNYRFLNHQVVGVLFQPAPVPPKAP